MGCQGQNAGAQGSTGECIEIREQKRNLQRHENTNSEIQALKHTFFSTFS